jgi:hypothetical protein
MQIQQTLSQWIQRISNKVWRYKHHKMVGQSQLNLPTSSSKGGKWPKAKATRDHELSLGVIGKEGCQKFICQNI